jgi:hypothetical protein
VKIVENHFGRGFFKVQHQVIAPIQVGPQPAPPGGQVIPMPPPT